jgi:uncharacterized protein YutE (UPF0331/DUF86 family)
MVLRPEAILARLKELDQVLTELDQYRDLTWDEFMKSLSQRWIVERGLMVAAAMIFDVADHIASGHFGQYAESYEQSLEMLRDLEVLPEELYAQMQGLGGFRNILMHGYLQIDPRHVYENLDKGLRVFPQYGQVVLAWLDAQERANGS